MGRGGRHVSGGLRVVGQDRLSRILRATIRTRQVREYQTRLGVYEEGCGLENVDLSWGHDEYLYHVVKDYLPEPKRCT